MKKLDPLLRNFITGTIIIILGMTGLAILFYYFIPLIINYILIAVAFSFAFILEYFWIKRYDKEKRIRKKSKMIEVGLIADDEDVKEEIEAEKRRLSQEVGGEKFVTTQLMDKFRSYMKLLITELSEIEVEIDNLYRDCIDMINNGMMMKAKDHFRIMSNASKIRIDEMEQDLGKKFNLFFQEKLKSQKTLKFLKSFREEWEQRKQKTLDIIKSASDKFDVKSYFQHYIEDLFNFEIEKQRNFSIEDNAMLKIPKDQLKKMLDTIEKPSPLNLDEISREKKEELGKIGKKVIAYFTNNDQHPNLPTMVMKLGIALSEAKDVLSYLKSIGMINEVKYHIK